MPMAPMAPIDKKALVMRLRLKPKILWKEYVLRPLCKDPK